MKSTYKINLQNRALHPRTVQASTREDAVRMATALFGNKKVSIIKIAWLANKRLTIDSSGAILYIIRN